MIFDPLHSQHLPTGAYHFWDCQCLSNDSLQNIAFWFSRRTVLSNDFNLIANNIATFQIIQIQCFAGIAINQQQTDFLLCIRLTKDRNTILLFRLIPDSDWIQLSRKGTQDQIGANQNPGSGNCHCIHSRTRKNTNPCCQIPAWH